MFSGVFLCHLGFDTLMSNLILTILILHFVGDFVLQSDWMAVNKSKSQAALWLHVAIYTTTLSPCLITLPMWWVIANGLFHYTTDSVTSRINAHLWLKGERHWFFVGIGADQLIHYATLILTLPYELLSPSSMTVY